MLKSLMAQAKDIEAKQANLREEIDKHYQRTIIEEERERLAPHPVDEPVRMEVGAVHGKQCSGWPGRG